ncbi:MAG: hypothetical protein OEY03_11385 [Rhizobacter sp.]|nr:hypothetical protein [Rhizobacter sp.]
MRIKVINALAARCSLPVFDGIACAVGQLRVLLAIAGCRGRA